MTDTKFVKIIIPYFFEKPIELYIRDNLVPTDLDMIRFKALNFLASEKAKDEIIRDMSKFLTLTGIEPINIDLEDSTSKIMEFHILL